MLDFGTTSLNPAEKPGVTGFSGSRLKTRPGFKTGSLIKIRRGKRKNKGIFEKNRRKPYRGFQKRRFFTFSGFFVYALNGTGEAARRHHPGFSEGGCGLINPSEKGKVA